MDGRCKKVGLFVCCDLIGIQIVNALVPIMLQLGISPVIYDSGMNKNRKFKIPAPPQISFYGVSILHEKIIPFLEEKGPLVDSRGNPLAGVSYTYRQLAALYKLEYHEITDVNELAFIDAIKIDDDLLGAISLRFLQIFDAEIINAFQEKAFFWNLHGGILPEYKGLLIPYRAIENNERDYGWTLHDMAGGIDTGDIILKRTMPLNPKMPVIQIYLDMLPAGVEMITQAIENHISGAPFLKTPHDLDCKKSYYTYPTAEEMQKFEQKGIKYIGSPKQYVDALIKMFSVVDSSHAWQLQSVIVSAMAEREYVSTGALKEANSNKQKSA